jgi:preprotein translocase subunit YajC
MIDVAYAQAGSAPQAGGPLVMFIQFLPLILVFVIFYFLVLRPQAKRQKDLQKQVAALKRGDRVVTAGGIFGEVADVKDTTVMLRISENVKVEFTKQSVVGVQNKEGS